MKEEQKERIYIIQETVFESILTDFVTFGSLVASFWFNYEFIGNGMVLQIVLGLCFFLAVFSKAGKKTRMTHEEARKHFSEDKP